MKPARVGRPRALHAAIVLPCYLDAMLERRKIIEARLARSRRLPFGRVAPGDEIYFRATAATAFSVRAVVERVEHFEALTPSRVRALRRRYNDGILARSAFWDAKRHARFATLIWIGGVGPIDRAPALPAPGRSAWAVAGGPGR